MCYSHAMNEHAHNLISASELSRIMGIPIPTIYRLAEKGRIPFEDHTQKWHERRFYRFDLEAVRQALEGSGRRTA